MKKIWDFISKSSYSLLAIITSIVFMSAIYVYSGNLPTPLGEVSFNDTFEFVKLLPNVKDSSIDMPELESIEDEYLTSNNELDDISLSFESNETNSKESDTQIANDDSQIDNDNSDTYIEENLDEKENESDIIEAEPPSEEAYNVIPVKECVTEAVWNSTLNEDGTYSWLEEFDKGATPLEYYEPEAGGSRYYRDLGIIAGNTTADYKVEGNSYFDNTCWIGDSRMLGVYDYCTWNADFYCDNGFCFYNYHLGKSVTYQNEHRKVNLNEIMQEKSYDKIYVIMGINDCGYLTTTDIRGCMKEFVDMLRETQPNAIIFLCASMHVTEKIASSKPIYSNRNINSKNIALASLADGEKVFYLDYNYLYVDENGYLKSENTFDGFHLYGTKYDPLISFFYRHGIPNNIAE